MRSLYAALTLLVALEPSFVMAQGRQLDVPAGDAASSSSQPSADEATSSASNDTETLRISVSAYLGFLGRYDYNLPYHPTDAFGNPDQSDLFPMSTSAGASISASLCLGRYFLVGLDVAHHSYQLQIARSHRRHLLRVGVSAGIHRELRTTHLAVDPMLQIGAGLVARLPRYRTGEGSTRLGWFFSTRVGATVWFTRIFGVTALWGVEVIRIFDQDHITSNPDEVTRKMAEGSIHLGLAFRL